MAYNPLDAFAPAYQTPAQIAAANAQAAIAKANTAQAASTASANATPGVTPTPTTFTPVQPTGTVTLAGGAKVPVASATTQGPVATGATAPVNPTYSAYPAAGTVISSSQTPNGDGTFSVTQIVADGHGGTTSVNSQSGAKTSGTAAIPTLARDTFNSTFSLIFGAKEAGQAYVGKLYDLVAGFYKTGASMDDSINLAVRQAMVDKSIPEFTDRFAGIFSLMDKQQKGFAVKIPTVAEYIASENDIAATLNNAGLGDLATQKYINDILGAGNSVKSVTDKITSVFSRIDNAPQAFKDAMNTSFAALDRVSLAKAILGGTDTVDTLQKRVETTGLMTQASAQGLAGMTSAQAGDLSALGNTYETSAAKFAQASQSATGMDMFNQIYGKRYGGYGTTEALAQSFNYGNVAQANTNQTNLIKAEQGQFGGQSGTQQSQYGISRTSFGTGAGTF
jgi:hypothetical protein